jgi:hypothetical protein
MSYLDKFNFDEITTWDLKQVNQTVQHAVKLALPFLLAEIEPHIGFMIKEQLEETKAQDDDVELDDKTVKQALKECLEEGLVDTEIEEKIQSVISDGSWDFDISFSA